MARERQYHRGIGACAIEAPKSEGCKRGDILVGQATVKAFKHGWALLGSRFTSNKLRAIEHAKRIDRMLVRG